MKTLGSLLHKKYRSNSPIKKTDIDDATVFFIFKKILQMEYGNAGSGKFTADYFSKKTLHIKAKNSAWAAELWTNRGKLIKKINLELGGVYIEKLKMN
jgi:hypothetical protein